MSREIRLPELGENIEGAQVLTVLVNPGDTIAQDQALIEVETDKATAEVPSPAGGVVETVHVSAGDEVVVGQLVVTLATADEDERAEEEKEREQDDEAQPSPSRAAAAAEVPVGRAASTSPPPTQAVPRLVEVPAPAEEPAPVTRLVPAAPSVRRLARELGVRIEEVAGSGPGGRLSAEDVKTHVREALGARSGGRAAHTDSGAGAGPTREPMSNIRRRTAERMAAAWATIPHVTQFDRADITDLEVWRKQAARRAEAQAGKLTVTAIVVRVTAAALRIFPKFNAAIDMERSEVVHHAQVNIGVAVDTERGLLVPVVRDADRKSVFEVAAEVTSLANRARERKIGLEDLRGGTFSITNLGGLGTTYFAPIINPPEVAILGVGRAEQQAVHREGGFVPRLHLPLSISYDHRLIDGADAARFLRWIAEALEQPLLAL